jgi:hypothetical protein
MDSVSVVTIAQPPEPESKQSMEESKVPAVVEVLPMCNTWAEDESRCYPHSYPVDNSGAIHPRTMGPLHNVMHLSIAEEHECGYCGEAVEQSFSPYCDRCGWWGWYVYDEGFVTLANRFCEAYQTCHDKAFDVADWTRVVEDCNSCEAHRKHVLETYDRMNARFAALAQEFQDQDSTREQRRLVAQEALRPFLVSQNFHTHHE